MCDKCLTAARELCDHEVILHSFSRRVPLGKRSKPDRIRETFLNNRNGQSMDILSTHYLYERVCEKETRQRCGICKVSYVDDLCTYLYMSGSTRCSL